MRIEPVEKDRAPARVRRIYDAIERQGARYEHAEGVGGPEEWIERGRIWRRSQM